VYACAVATSFNIVITAEDSVGRKTTITVAAAVAP
jgi:hypothetical protein